MGKDWIGDIPKRCNLCEHKLVGTFVDGRLLTTGCWTIMCIPCHVLHGVGLGAGRGQLYNILGEKLKG